MTTVVPDAPVTDAAEVAPIVAAIRRAGRFAIDLEFMTEGRYVPELSLVQVGWGDPASPEVVAIDPLKVDPRPIFELVASTEVEAVFHAAQADLSLIGALFEIRAGAFYDTQVAASFLGMGDQVSYAGLVERITGVALDKAAQFTEWSRRPLSPEQLRYALDDVRYLLAVWEVLREDLEARGRLRWVAEECVRLGEGWAERTPPEGMYFRIRGWNTLRPRQMGALRGLAAWREREALRVNRPPSWLLNDRTLLELCRRPPRDERAMRDVRGLGDGTIARYGAEIMRTIRVGMDEPPPPAPRSARVPPLGQAWPPMLSGIVQDRCRDAEIAPRFVATRSDLEEIAQWWLIGDRDREPDVPLLSGWRRELAGNDVLAWLRGDIALAVDATSQAGVRIVPVEGFAAG